MAQTNDSFWSTPGVRYGVKLGVLIVLLLLLLIPLGLIRGIVAEREALHAEAVLQVTDQAGGEQLIAGPVLSVPVELEVASTEGVVRTERRRLFVLADQATIQAEIEAEVLRRGIYDVPVYATTLTISAIVPAQKDIELPAMSGATILWDQAELLLGVARLDGLRTEPTVAQSSSAPVAVQGSSVRFGSLPTVSVPLMPDPASTTHITVNLSTNGGASFSVVPTAARATVEIASSWPDPGFRGRQVPAERSVGADGFSAQWESTALGLGLPPVTEVTAGTDPGFGLRSLGFGVELYQPVDRYQRSLRAVKYGPLFLLLPFVAIFLMEVWSGQRVHPVQYLLVAAAKLIFYLILVSLSEQVPFAAAYWSATAATIGVIGVYLFSVLATRWQAGVMTGIIAGEYLFLYSALVSREYALLIGSLGLFVVVAITMLSTRRVDWYAPQLNKRIDPLTK